MKTKLFKFNILIFVFLFIKCESLSTIPQTNHPGFITPDSISHAIPGAFNINSVSPNPFEEETRIVFSVPLKAEIHLVIQNPIGDVVKVLLAQQVSPGRYQLTWNGTNDNIQKVNKGKYFVTLGCKSRDIYISQLIKYGN